MMSILLAAALAATPPPLVPGTHVRMAPPAGFIPGVGFSGYKQSETSASVVITELPAPFSAVMEEFTAKSLSARGMKLLSREPHQSGEHQGLLLHVEQTGSGISVEKWIVALGTKNATVLMTATFMAEHSKQLSAPLKTAVSEARWEPKGELGKEAPLPFDLGKTPGLKPAHRIHNMVTFTRDGTMAGLSMLDPTFVVGQSVVRAPPGDVKDVAEALVRQSVEVEDLMKDLEIESGAPVEVAGMKGYELVAHATDTDLEQRIVVYQLFLPYEGGSFVVQGRVGEASRAKYLERFKTAARSFEPRN